MKLIVFLALCGAFAQDATSDGDAPPSYSTGTSATTESSSASSSSSSASSTAEASPAVSPASLPPAAESSPASSGSSSANISAIKAPPLGQASGQMQQWTASSILSTVGQNNEDTAGDRFKLQNALIASAPETNASMAGLQASADSVKKDILTFANKLVNVTTLLNADLTAGGMIAVSRSLISEMPATQTLLTKTMNAQVKNLQQQSLAMKQALETTESTYKTQLRSFADTVSSLIAQQDAAYARQAAAQARAMNRTTQGAGQFALSQTKAVNAGISKNATALNKIAASSSAGISTAQAALSDASDALGEAQSQASQAVQAAQTAVMSNVDAQTDKSTNAIAQQTSKVTVSAETQAMYAAQQLNNGLGKLDTLATKQMNGLITGANQNSSHLSDAIDMTGAKQTKSIDQTVASVSGKVSGIVGKANAATADGASLAQDAQSLLAKQQAAYTDSSSGFQTDFSKLQSLVSAQMSAAAQGAKAASQDILGGTGGESQRLLSILSYLLQQAGADSSQMSGTTQAKLAAAQKAQASALARQQSGISDTQNQIASANTDAQNAGVRSSGALSGRVAGMSSTYGGSIADLASALGDAEGAASNALSQLGSSLNGKAANAFSDVMEALRGANGKAGNGQEAFLNSVFGPNQESQRAQFTQLLKRLQSIAGDLDGQSGSQSSAMEALSAFQNQYNSQLGSAGDTLKQMAAMSAQAANGVGDQGENALASSRASVMALLFSQLNAARNASGDGLGQIDQLIHSLVGGPNSENQQNVRQLFAVSGANLDQGSAQFTQASQDQLKSLAGLQSMLVSMLGQYSNQASADTADTAGMLSDAKESIMDNFRKIAENTTSDQLGSTLATLARNGNNSEAVNSLLRQLQAALGSVDADAGSASEAAATKRAQFGNYISQTSGDLDKSQTSIMAQLAQAIDDVEDALASKVAQISSSQDEMHLSLNNITDKVNAAQQTLVNNLALYQDKIDGIIAQIKSYMNLSQNADELAISQDISRQLGKVNATEIAVASANAAVADKISSTSSSRNASGSATYLLVNNVINGAIGTQTSSSDGHIANTERLTEIAANVDDNANQLQDSLGASSQKMRNGITESASTAAAAMSAGEGSQAKSVDQINSKAADVASQSRKGFIAHLQKMGNVDDDTSMITQQLAQLLDNSNGSIDDISQSALSHLNLNVRTMAKLNAADVRKVASVSDVMNAFSNVVTTFLNETGGSMQAVMNRMNLVDASSAEKLKQIGVRSSDEQNWLHAGINSTSDGFHQIIDQERIIQSGLERSVAANENDFSTYVAKKQSEISDVQDAVSALHQDMSQSASNQMAQVQSWINSRNPQVAQSLFGAKSSFLEAKSRDAIINDIAAKVAAVREDLQSLRGTRV